MTRRCKAEDYVKTIYALRANGVVRSVQIARALKVSKATVSVSLKTLEAEGFLFMKEGHAIELTVKGLALAKEVTRRYNVFYELLIKSGVDKATAAQDACCMEHALSEESFHVILSLAEQQLGLQEPMAL